MTPALHPQTSSQLNSLTTTLAGSYIFHGPRAVGKATTAGYMARKLNCQGDNGGLCASCKLFDAGNYPDFILVKPEDKPSIVIEQIRTLLQALSLGLYHPSGVRVVVIDGADVMTTEAQNALLKIIEEPPTRTLFLLVAQQLPALLPTVRSRCGLIYFPRLSAGQVAEALTQHHGVPGAEAAKLAQSADGAIGQALHMIGNAELAEARLALDAKALSSLESTLFDRFILAGKLAADKADLQRFGEVLHAHVIHQLRNGQTDPATAGRRLGALEYFRRQLNAKVSARVSLERLMVEL